MLVLFVSSVQFPKKLKSREFLRTVSRTANLRFADWRRFVVHHLNNRCSTSRLSGVSECPDISESQKLKRRRRAASKAHGLHLVSLSTKSSSMRLHFCLASVHECGRHSGVQRVLDARGQRGSWIPANQNFLL